MLMADHLEQQGRPERLGRVTVDATDIDRQCLERAQAGRYRREALTEVPADLVERYFEPTGDECRVIERVRRRVRRAAGSTSAASRRPGGTTS